LRRKIASGSEDPPPIPDAPVREQREYVNAYWQGNVLVLVERPTGPRSLPKLSRKAAEHACFLKADTSPELLRELRGSSHVLGIAREDDWLRVRWRDREFAQRGCEWLQKERATPTFEGDVTPVQRWLADEKPKIAKPRAVYLDIETDSRVTFAKAIAGDARVLCWSLVDAETGAEFCAVLEADTDAAERDLLQALWDTLLAYDQVIAWNGDAFDFPIILARSKKRECRASVRRLLLLDHLNLFQRMNMMAAESGEEKQSFKLEAIAQAVLGEGKDDFDASKTWESWAAGGAERDRMARYCMKDTVLLRKIEVATGYVALLQTLCEACGCFPDSRSINPLTYVEGFMLRLGVERKHRFPTRLHFHGPDDKREKFKGAMVIEPRVRGIAKNVHVADFASLYPSIILTWNLSPETYRSDIVLVERPEARPAYLSHVPLKRFPIPPGHCVVPLVERAFVTEPLGILVVALEEMLRLRKYWNDLKASLPPGTPEWVEADRRSTAYKIAANSFYGVVGAIFSRLFAADVAESIPRAGVWLLTKTVEAAELEKFNVIYGDTDSFYAMGTNQAEFGAFVKRCNAELYPRLVAQQGCTRNVIKLAYEKAYERVVFLTAKRYVARIAHYKGSLPNQDTKPEVKGIEYKRGDAARLARDLQAKVIDRLLGGGILRQRVPDDQCEERPEAFFELIEEALEYVLRGELKLADVMQSKRLSQPLGSYARKLKKDGTQAAQPPHVVIAHELKKRGRHVGEGVKVEFFCVDGHASPKRYAPAEDWAGECDRHDLWESVVYPATQRLLEAAFPVGDWRRWESTRPKAAPSRQKAAGRATAAGTGERSPESRNEPSGAPARRKRQPEPEGALSLFPVDVSAPQNAPGRAGRPPDGGQAPGRGSARSGLVLDGLRPVLARDAGPASSSGREDPNR